LDLAQPGQRLQVVGVAGIHEFEVCECFDRRTCSLDSCAGRRVLEMGLVPGARVTLLSNRDPVIIGQWGGRTAMSRGLAGGVFVVPDSASMACGGCCGSDCPGCIDSRAA
jgi:Fe2+ transport system protein FeoA